MKMSRLALRWMLCLLGGLTLAAEPQGEIVSFHGYNDCIRLSNASARVTLCPAAGGRVLEYSRNGVNALYLGDEEQGWRFEPGKPGGAMHAGRFDIGPEQTIPAHPMLWKGPWKGKLTGDRAAQLVSVKDEPTGVQLTRDFQLAAESTRLTCKQTIRNVSQQTVEYCHWSRTFAHGGGIVVIPLGEQSRFPEGYVMYAPAPLIQFRPQDDQIVRSDGFLEIRGAPAHPKLGFDSSVGWLAYLMRNDLMFVKQFPVDTNRVYNEVAGLTLSVWYPKDRPMCELEPIGPRERLAPGEQASFTETWWLLEREFPKTGRADLAAVAAQVAREASAPQPGIAAGK